MTVPVSFDYKAPDSIEEALALLHESKDARLLAGGHELLTRLKLRHETAGLLVDLRNFPELKNIAENLGKSAFHIGAMVTCNDLVTHFSGHKNLGVLVEAADSVGDAQVRNCTTVGGNLGGGNPAADLAAAFLALDANMTIRSHSGTREVSADQFFVGPFETVLKADEMITQIVVPVRAGLTVTAYEKIRNPASSYPLCAAAVVVRLTEKDLVSDCRVAITGASTRPVRLPVVEDALKGKTLDPATIEKASSQGADNMTFLSDHAASAEYRAHLANVTVERALTKAASLIKSWNQRRLGDQDKDHPRDNGKAPLPAMTKAK